MFFVSSRRGHTRSLRDWSSDVCSSDLNRRCGGLARQLLEIGAIVPRTGDFENGAGHVQLRERADHEVDARSEERRVGKECRAGPPLSGETETVRAAWTGSGITGASEAA